jgi:predicted dehydrogenase
MKIPIAVVGLNFGQSVIHQIVSGSGSPYFELAAVCDINAEKARMVADSWGVKAYSDLEDLLADESIRAVGLITGPNGRAGLLRRIIRSGKDVMTTKPFELDPQAALEVLAESRSLGRVIHLNSPSPLPSPDLQQILDWIEEYRLGKPIACRCDSWHGYAKGEVADGSWYDDPLRCPVAPIYRIGIYGINDLVRLWGDAQIVQVLETRRIAQRPTPDTAQMNLRFKNGALATVFSSLVVGDNEHREGAMTLNYEFGSIYRNSGPGVERESTRLALVSQQENEIVRLEKIIPGWSGDYQWDVFFQAIQGRDLPGLVTPDQIAGGLRIIQAMARAASSGKNEEVE